MFHTGSAHGLRPSEVSPSGRHRSRLGWKNPRTVVGSLFPAPECRLGPSRLGFWVRTFRKCLAVDRVFSPSPAGASRGIGPSRALSEGLDRNFFRSPLTRFAGSGDCSPNPSASQSVDRPAPRLARHTTEVGTGRSHPCGVFAPACSWAFTQTGAWAMN